MGTELTVFNSAGAIAPTEKQYPHLIDGNPKQEPPFFSRERFPEFAGEAWASMTITNFATFLGAGAIHFAGASAHTEAGTKMAETVLPYVLTNFSVGIGSVLTAVALHELAPSSANEPENKPLRYVSERTTKFDAAQGMVAGFILACSLNLGISAIRNYNAAPEPLPQEIGLAHTMR